MPKQTHLHTNEIIFLTAHNKTHCGMLADDTAYVCPIALEPIVVPVCDVGTGPT